MASILLLSLPVLRTFIYIPNLALTCMVYNPEMTNLVIIEGSSIHTAKLSHTCMCCVVVVVVVVVVRARRYSCIRCRKKGMGL